MNSSLRTLLRFNSLLFLALGLLLSVPTKAQTGSQRRLSHRELKNLIKKAITRADHLKIAAYYHTEAVTLKRQSSEHVDLES